MASAAKAKDAWLEAWENPPDNCRPRTRWWWPGNRVTPEGIRQQLQAMKASGLAGCEIVSTWRHYSDGNLEWGTPEWAAMIRIALEEATTLGMTVSLAGSPGWDFGGPGVSPMDRSKCLAPCWLDLQGPFSYEGPLPVFRDQGTPKTGLYANLFPVEGRPADHGEAVAVSGARIVSCEGSLAVLDGETLMDLTDEFRGEAGRWRIGEGRWRLTAFRLQYTGQRNSAQDNRPAGWVVDHLDEGAMRRYADGVAALFRKEFGPWLGKTVDSVFADSFEVVPLVNTVLWSGTTLGEFRRRKGYDLAPLLPLVWWEGGPRTERVRYDLNHTLHELALAYCLRPFVEACARMGIAARVQPHYRFHHEVLDGAMAVDRPETEVTTARFETVADPRKATVSAARFAKRPYVSAEAYTFIHRERYRTTPAELKAATDAFLRDGVTMLYNHGWLYSEEARVTPMRDMPWASTLRPWSPWWPHYRDLAQYIGRCCWMLRQGEGVADVLLYSPQCQVWSERSVFNVQQRVMKYGDVPKTLVANGYDYDVVNDTLLGEAQVAGRRLMVRGRGYGVVIVPPVRVMPLRTVEVLTRWSEAGGTVLCLDRLPAAAPGHAGTGEEDRVRDRASKLECLAYGFQADVFSPQERPYAPTPPLREGQRMLLSAIARAVAPDLQRSDGGQSDGLAFHHRQAADRDLYFVTNLSPRAVASRVTVRQRGRAELWDPMTGERVQAEARPAARGTEVEVKLGPWHSVFLVFGPGSGARKAAQRREESIALAGPWRLSVEGQTRELAQLGAWSEDERLRAFSGVGVYVTRFRLPRGWKDRIAIDLGEVGCAAEVYVNGQRAGNAWMAPFRVRLPKQILRSENELEVRVANNLLAEVQGLSTMPASVRPELRAAWERDRAYEPLPLSGLAGPVRLLRWV